MKRKSKLDVFKDNKKVIHPKSRKAKQLSRKIAREYKIESKRPLSKMRLQVLGKKLIWFKDNMDFQELCTPYKVHLLIMKYVNRNEEELEQIDIKQNIGQRTSRQHASREDLLNFVKEKEMKEYCETGFETVDLLDSSNYQVFKDWDGQLRFLHNIKLCTYTKKQLRLLEVKNKSYSGGW